MHPSGGLARRVRTRWRSRSSDRSGLAELKVFLPCSCFQPQVHGEAGRLEPNCLACHGKWQLMEVIEYNISRILMCDEPSKGSD